MRAKSFIIKVGLLYACFASAQLFSQEILSGRITDEENNPIIGVMVRNMKSGVQSTSDLKGNFSISANQNDEIRFIHRNYERVSLNFNTEKPNLVDITMNRAAAPIEEVKIRPKLTGDLKKDSKTVGASPQVIATNKHIDKYIRQKADPIVLRAKPGEFVQPKGKGFATAKIGYKWDIFDFFKYIEANLSDEYFISLGIPKLEIYRFVNFVLEDFEKSDILRFGYCSNFDLTRFQVACENKLPLYKNNTQVVSK